MYYAKGYFLRAHASCLKHYFLFEKHHMETFVCLKYICGVRSHQGFYNTHGILFTLAGVEIPACCGGERSFSADKNFNLSSVSAGYTESPEQSHIPTAPVVSPPPKSFQLSGPVMVLSPT